MTELSAGDKAPNFKLETADGKVSLADYNGDYLVLYFYPKDDTPGCTKEAIAFTAHKAAFKKQGAQILGVSKDPVAQHEKFSTKHDLTIALGADEDGKVCQAYGVWVEKNMYGKKYMGIQRATFLIDPKGRIAQVWPKVKVKDHAEDVFRALKEFSST